MKKIYLLFLLTLGIDCKAQSSEAGYPVGTWQSNPEASEVFVDISIWRENTPNPDYGNKLSCGELSIDSSPSYDAMLTYAGRGLDKNGMPINVFYFNVLNANNKSSQIAVRKMKSKDNEIGNGTKISIIQVTGDLANNSALKQQLYSVGGGNGAAFDPTPLDVTEKELMASLKDGVANGWNLRGFGNIRQYINAHSKLILDKPKYAKCKGTNSINIRKDNNPKAEKIGELKPGTTLLVVDEFDGWCMVCMKERQFGWVSLSVVELTNTPTAITSTEATTQNNSTGGVSLDGPAIVDNHLAFLGISLGESATLVKTKLVAKGMKINNNGDGSSNVHLTGVIGDVQSTVTIGVTAKNTVFNISLYDKKSYRLPQAKTRYNTLLTKLESIYGKGKYESNQNDYKRYHIRTSKGLVTLDLFNEDEMDGASNFYSIGMSFSENF